MTSGRPQREQARKAQSCAGFCAGSADGFEGAGEPHGGRFALVGAGLSSSPQWQPATQ